MAKLDLSKLPEGRAPLPDEWFRERAQMQKRIEELEANLAKAMEAFDEVMNFIDIEAYDILRGGGMYKIAKAYADLGGVIPDEWADALNRAAELKGGK